MVLKGNLYEMVTQEDNLTRDCWYNWDNGVRYNSYTHYYPHQKQSVNVSLEGASGRYVLYQYWPIARLMEIKKWPLHVGVSLSSNWDECKGFELGVSLGLVIAWH